MATAHLQAQALTIRKYSAVEHTLFQNNALKRLLEPIRHLKRAVLDIRAIFLHTATSMKQVFGKKNKKYIHNENEQFKMMSMITFSVSSFYFCKIQSSYK